MAMGGVSRRRKGKISDWEKLRAFELEVYRKCLLAGEWTSVECLYPRVGDGVPPAEMKALVMDARKKQKEGREGPPEEITLSKETELLLGSMSKECVSCRLILEDFRKNGFLTDHPGNYPLEAKVEHVKVEKGWSP